ncbi:MAG: hypothetical protein NDI69_09175 [Bacteriovoracaceae bacterium]|nr:hypothetical protein [Bacteriovoracaceae bacterium]
MKIHLVTRYEDSIPSVVSNKIESDTLSALRKITANSNKVFIVNPTIWYTISPTKSGEFKPKPKVMNSADYISKLFGKNLSKLGWVAGEKEQTINDQKIDGYIEIETDLQFYKIPEDKFLEFFTLLKMKGLLDNEKNFRSNFNSYYCKFCSSSWFMDDKLPNEIKKFFVKAPSRKVIAGLEFETGNISSSFRALTKLDYLFLEGHIDLGIFVTSIDRATTAGKIWPISNRNGSFAELKNRNYRAGLNIPMLEIGFEPQELDTNAKFLASDGSLYEPSPTKEFRTVNNRKFQKFVYMNSPCWKEIL